VLDAPRAAAVPTLPGSAAGDAGVGTPDPPPERGLAIDGASAASRIDS
jgi:hypothetical protein